VISPDGIVKIFKDQKVQIKCNGAELMLLIASIEMAAANISDPENIYDLRMKLEDQAKALIKRSISG
jgi:hypothetical protein